MILYINYIADQVYATSADKWQIDNDFWKWKCMLKESVPTDITYVMGQTYKLYLIWYLNQMILFGLLMKKLYII